MAFLLQAIPTSSNYFSALSPVKFIGLKSKIRIPLKNGQCYAFTRDINTIWRHGVPQLKNNTQNTQIKKLPKLKISQIKKLTKF